MIHTICPTINTETDPINFPVKEYCTKHNIRLEQHPNTCFISHENLSYIRCVEQVIYKCHRKSVQPEWQG